MKEHSGGAFPIRQQSFELQAGRSCIRPCLYSLWTVNDAFVFDVRHWECCRCAV